MPAPQFSAALLTTHLQGVTTLTEACALYYNVCDQIQRFAGGASGGGKFMPAGRRTHLTDGALTQCTAKLLWGSWKSALPRTATTRADGTCSGRCT